jgi:hypothetical protein
MSAAAAEERPISNVSFVIQVKSLCCIVKDQGRVGAWQGVRGEGGQLGTSSRTQDTLQIHEDSSS